MSNKKGEDPLLLAVGLGLEVFGHQTEALRNVMWCRRLYSNAPGSLHSPSSLVVLHSSSGCDVTHPARADTYTQVLGNINKGGLWHGENVVRSS